MTATGDDDDEVLRLCGKRPRIELEALACFRIRVLFNPGRAAGTHEVFHGNARMLEEEFAHFRFGPAKPRHCVGHHTGYQQNARCALLVTEQVGEVGCAHEIRHAVHALVGVFLGGFFFSTATANVGGAIGKRQRDGIRTACETVALGRMRRPVGRQIVFIFGKHDVGVTHAAVVGHRTDPRQRATNVLLNQAQRPPDARPRRTLRIGAQTTEAGIQADLLRDRTVDHDHRISTA